ncbi:Nsa1p [Sugiyamaella lignohabitans]|uniref:Ribosome biogenesis protein NSA1 n=1 Tax=Sugiyamaella lignohabitans TaxID=796027 RepID=A0A167DQW1_9ASCO|nr:Nsa1p [Sugiyamaella lignohabitans]ANB13183.1 Nsa1p [Sugiyamaella lignohabitans]
MDTSVKDAPQELEIETYASEGRKNCIDRLLVFKSKKYGHRLVAVARRTGSVELYDADNKYEQIKSWTVEKKNNEDDEKDEEDVDADTKKAKTSLLSTEPFIVGFDILPEHNVLVSCDRNGEVALYELDNLEKKPVTWGAIKETPLKGQNRYARKNGNSEGGSSKPTSPISVFKSNPYNEGEFAYGGNKVNLTIISLDFSKRTLTQTWQAKNVKNDRLDLALPVIINNVFWFTQPTKKDTSKNETGLLSLTGDGFIRQYDPTKQMRPVSETKIGENNTTNSNTMNARAGATGVTGASRKEVDIRLKAVCAGNNDNSIIYTDDRSNITYFDIHKNVNGGKYNGPTGTVQALHTYDNELLAAGGLDRYLRIYDITTRDQVAKIYVGTHISSLWILDDDENANNKKRRAADHDEQADDELWNELETVSKKKKSTK